jgi:hypothetical protein
VLTVIREDKNPEVLIVTPLWPGHKISRETKKTIKRNDTPISWYSYSDYNNIPQNWWSAIRELRSRKKKLPKYFLPLDRDIILGRYMIDRMVNVFEGRGNLRTRNRVIPAHTAYIYCNFEFKGTVNREFLAEPFDINRLTKGNYISSNSLMNLDTLEFIGGPVTDPQYVRLLDWALWLKFAQFGYIGHPCKEANFVAISSENDISAGSPEDYQLKHQRVHEDFVKPLIKQVSTPTAYETAEPTAVSDIVKMDF